MSFCVTFFSVAPFAPLLKYTCYMCNRQGAHKSHRISSSLCSHDNALLYLYWYLHFMLIWPWCILSYVWWEAVKLFWIWKPESEEVPYCFLGSSIKFQGHTGRKMDDSDPIWVRLVGRSQLSNPSDWPCLFQTNRASVLPATDFAWSFNASALSAFGDLICLDNSFIFAVIVFWSSRHKFSWVSMLFMDV